MSDAIDPRALRPSDDEPTGRLIREAIDEASALAKLELALARDEIRSEMERMRAGAVALGFASGVLLVGVAVLLVGVALIFSSPWRIAVIGGGVLVVLSLTTGLVAWRVLPKAPMVATKERVGSDLKQLRERVA